MPVNYFASGKHFSDSFKSKTTKTYLLLVTAANYLVELQEQGLLNALQTIVHQFATRYNETIIWQVEELNLSNQINELPLAE